MSEVLNVFLPSGTNIKLLKAPTNMMYKIFGISVHSNTIGSQAISVLDMLLEDEVTVFDPFARTAGIIFIHEFDEANSFVRYYEKGIETKFLSFITRVTNMQGITIIIDYELKRATKSELILEWFRKGR